MIAIRSCLSIADDEESLRIHNAVWPSHAASMDEVRSWRSQLVRWAEFLVPDAGSVAVSFTPWHPDVPRVDVTVLPEQRRRGVGSALYRHASAWIAEQGVDEMDAPVGEDDRVSLDFALERRFVEHARSERLVLELADLEPPPVAAPGGIEIVRWSQRPELIQGIYDVAREALPDIPGEEDAVMEPFDDWLAHEMQGSADSPEATFVALASDEVVGYAKFHLTSARPSVALHDVTGVKRAWRRRGVAGALKRAQIAWAKERGFEQLETAPDLRNEPSRRMNERLGYERAPGRVIMRGPLASA